MKSRTPYPSKSEGDKWAVIDNIIEINGKKTPHPEEAGVKFQLKDLEEKRKFYEEKYNHKVYIYYSEVNDQ